jgi:hypothetical protein
MRYEDRRELAVKAVNRRIADVEAKRLLENKELAETIAVCIRESALPQLQTLKWLLAQQELSPAQVAERLASKKKGHSPTFRD